MEHIKLFWSRLNIRKLLKACSDNAQWAEVTCLYLHYDEFDNAVVSMMAYPDEAWNSSRFKDTVVKVTDAEIIYKAIDFYLAQQPLLLNDLLSVILQRVDHVRVISQIRKSGHMALVKSYLLQTQPLNIKEVRT
jgi:clathrin heavy chain